MALSGPLPWPFQAKARTMAPRMSHESHWVAELLRDKVQDVSVSKLVCPVVCHRVVIGTSKKCLLLFHPAVSLGCVRRSRGGRRALTAMLVIDTDAAGLTRLAMDIDDDVALLMALQQHVAAITITWGNAPAAMSKEAAKHLLARVARSDVPLYLGSECSWPLPHACPIPVATDASRAISRLGAAHPRQVTLVALGPLSNVAVALRDSPSLANQLKAIVMVGGSINPRASLAARLAANFYWLPDLYSAEMVFGSRLRKVLVPIETMASAYLEEGDLMSLRDQCCSLHPSYPSGAAVCDYLPAMVTKAKARVMDRLFPDRAPVQSAALVPWDAVVMAYVQNPALFSPEQLFVASLRWHGVTLSPVAGRANASEPFVSLVPTGANRSAAVAHITSVLCKLDRRPSTEGAEATSRAIAWANLPVAVLNRGVHALEPVGVAARVFAVALAVPLCLLLLLLHVLRRWLRLLRAESRRPTRTQSGSRPSSDSPGDKSAWLSRCTFHRSPDVWMPSQNQATATEAVTPCTSAVSS